jgi:hypothetical protein
MPAPGQSGNTSHFRFVQNQQHENFIGNIPFALDSMLAGGSELESGIVVRVADHKDKGQPASLSLRLPASISLLPIP